MLRFAQMIGQSVNVYHIETPTSGRLLVRAPDAGAPAGVLVGFHGYAESADAQMERLAGIGATDQWLLVSVQALNRFYRGRSEETVASWMTRQDREVAIATNIIYVDRVIDWVRKEYTLDIADSASGDATLKGTVPLLHAGFSQGTAMAFRAAVRGRWRSAGIVGAGGDVPPELLADPGTAFPPVLLVRGTKDEWYTQEKLDADVEALRARGVAVETFVFDGGHEWSGDASNAAAGFVSRLSAVSSQLSAKNSKAES
jgi:predicted esterase